MMASLVLRAALFGGGLSFLVALGGQSVSFWRFRKPAVAALLLFISFGAGAFSGRLAVFANSGIIALLALAFGLLAPPQGVLWGRGLLFLAGFAASADFGAPLAVFFGGVLGIFAAAFLEKRANSARRPEIAAAFRSIGAAAVFLCAAVGMAGL